VYRSRAIQAFEDSRHLGDHGHHEHADEQRPMSAIKSGYASAAVNFAAQARLRPP